MHQTIISLLASVLVAACAMGGPPAEPAFDARIRAFSTSAASLGTVIDAYGEGLPDPSDGQLALIFEGVFRRDDGATEDVALEVPTRRVDGGTLRWDGFGPYSVPFTRTGDRLGELDGTVRVRWVTAEGETVDAAATTPVRLRVLPSIVVRSFQPRAASCAEPVLRALGGVPYVLEVEAVGFEPSRYTYTFTVPSLGVADSIRHVGVGPRDRVGDDGSILLPEVPDGSRAYGLIVSVQARGADGTEHQTLFALGVHRPMEVYYDGHVDVAELHAPAPVSGCIPGGVTGRVVEYTESESETRSRSYAVDWNDAWLSSHTRTHSESSTSTTSQSNTVGMSTTDGSSFNWQVGGEGGGTFGIGGLVEVGLKTSGHVGGESFQSSTRSNSQTLTVGRSETTTDTESVTDEVSGSTGEEFRWQVSSTDQLARGLSASVVAGTHGVFYRQTVRLRRRASLLTFNLCGRARVVGDVELQDWTWAPDLGVSSTCPPLPRSNLPPPQCVIPPCDGSDR